MELHIYLIPAPDDPPLFSPEYQSALRKFAQDAQSQGLEIRSKMRLLESVAGGGYLGDFFIKIAQTLGSMGLGGLVGAWLQAKHGRKVRLKVGEVEAEAETVEQIEKLLALAEKLQQRGERKVIHEP